MASQKTYLRLVNNTALKMQSITITEIDARDWDGATYRPDTNFQNTSLNPYQVRVQREEVNYWAGTSWYRMHILFENGDSIHFKRDQKEALRDNNSRFTLEGFSASKYIALQSARSDLNTIHISPAFDPKTWMSKISGSVKLSGLNIPGTHDTCALYGGATYECQTLSLKDQLEAGIRYIDIRCRHYHDTFPIHHDSIYQRKTFDDVVNVCINFLSSNPEECIIMSVKKEYNDSGNTRSFEDTFDVFIQRHPGLWFLGDTIPTMHEARGKVVLLRRFDAVRLPKGIPAIPNDWEDDGTFWIHNSASTLRIQDEYKVATLGNIDDKWDKVELMLREAANLIHDDWVLNYCSGSDTTFPVNVAKGLSGTTGVNDFLFNFIIPQTNTRYGTIILDFPEYHDFGLVASIINLNAFNWRRPISFLTRVRHYILAILTKIFRS